MKARKPTTPPIGTRTPVPPEEREIAPGLTATRSHQVRCPVELAAPDAYAVILEGDCLSPHIQDGDTAIVSPSAPLTSGEYCVLWPVEGRPLMKRLVSAPPWRPGPRGANSNVFGIAICEMVNPPQQFMISYENLKAIHAVMGVMRDGEIVHAAPRAKEPVAPKVPNRGR